MRIAKISVHASPLSNPGGQTDGGMNVYVKELAKELGKAGDYVDIFVRRHDSSLPEVVWEDSKVRIIQIEGGPCGIIDKNLVWEYLPEFTRNMLRFIEREGLIYSIIHGHYWYSGCVALSLGKILDIPVVHNFHSLSVPKIESLISYGDGGMEEEHPKREEIEELIMADADRLVVTSQQSKQHLLTYYNLSEEKVKCIPCGVNPEIFKPMPRDISREKMEVKDKKIILFVGRIKPVKGLVTLVEALSILLKRNTENFADSIEVLITGGEVNFEDRNRNSEYIRIKNMADKLGINGQIRYIGPVFHKDLPSVYSAADICVVPSYYESFCMVALEAMSCGIPVVGSDVGGLPDLINDGLNGFLVGKGDSEMLAQRIELLLKDESLRQKMGERAVHSTRTFSWQRISEEMKQLYYELLMENSWKRSFHHRERVHYLCTAR